MSELRQTEIDLLCVCAYPAQSFAVWGCLALGVVLGSWVGTLDIPLFFRAGATIAGLFIGVTCFQSSCRFIGLFEKHAVELEIARLEAEVKNGDRYRSFLVDIGRHMGLLGAEISMLPGAVGGLCKKASDLEAELAEARERGTGLRKAHDEMAQHLAAERKRKRVNRES